MTGIFEAILVCYYILTSKKAILEQLMQRKVIFSLSWLLLRTNLYPVNFTHLEY